MQASAARRDKRLRKRMNKFDDFRHTDWETYWSGDWSVLDVSYWEAFYTSKGFTNKIDLFVPQTIIEWKNGKSTCYLRISDKEKFAEKVIALIKQDENYADEICNGLKNAADDFLKFVNQWLTNEITPSQYLKYQELILQYYPLHIQVKVCVDFLPPELLKRFLPKFQEARVYAEPVFSHSVKFANAFARVMSKKTSYAPEFIKVLTKDEFENWIKTNNLPPKDALEKRNRHCLLLCSGGTVDVTTMPKEIAQIERFLIAKPQSGQITGVCAFAGKIRGKVRIVNDPAGVEFKGGEILVSRMTRPEYLPLIQKAAAFVTDGGGVLSHAAIVARELKKPCVIGTKIATKVFKDGDLVEVDAVNGVVRKISD